MFEVKTYDNNILAYHGPISIDLITSLVKYVKERVKGKAQVVSRVHKVFVELVQNVSYYSAESIEPGKPGKGIGWVSVDCFDDSYSISTGNLINSNHGPILLHNCDEINSLNENELRDLKRKTRSQSDIRDIGAHIGLITTGMISGNKLDISILKVDEKRSFFTIKVKIEK